MARFQWKSKRTIGLVVGLFFLYLLIRIKTYKRETTIALPDVHPNRVWEFVADFSNMKYLNPTIVDFNIIDESGNYEHWKYTVEYEELLSHWPYLPNYSTANFDIKSNPQKETYYVNSVHQTCLFSKLFCLNSKSNFKFLYSNVSKKVTVCEETVKYECPVFLSLFCEREVLFQRNAIMQNLEKHFVK